MSKLTRATADYYTTIQKSGDGTNLVKGTADYYTTIQKSEDGSLEDDSIEFAWVTGELAGTDAGSRATADLSYYEAFKEDYLMLGHGYSDKMLLVKKGPNVREATGWFRVYTSVGGKGVVDSDVYIPTHSDPDFRALGVVCAFGYSKHLGNHPEPRLDFPVALVRKECCTPISIKPLKLAWSDAGSGATDDISLIQTSVGTMWPSIATAVGFAPQVYSLKSKYWSYPAISGKIPTNGIVVAIKSVSSNKYLDGKSYGNSANTPPGLTSHAPQADEQLKWTIEDMGNNLYAIKSVSSDLYLDGRGGESTPWLTNRPPRGDRYLNWTFEPMGDTKYAIKSVSSNNYLDGGRHESSPSLTNRPPQGDKYLNWDVQVV